MVPNIVSALTSKSSDTITDIAAYTFTKYPVTKERAASPGNPIKLKRGASISEITGRTLKYLRNIMANDTPAVIFRSHTQVFVVLGSTLFIHHNIFSLVFMF
jgi:hypothetical protein